MLTQQQGATKIYFQTLWHLLMPGNLTEVKECDRHVQSKILNSTSSSMRTGSAMSMQEKESIVVTRVGLPSQRNPVAWVTIMKTQKSNMCKHTPGTTVKTLQESRICILLSSMSQRPSHQFFLAVFCPCLLMPAQVCQHILQAHSLILLWCVTVVLFRHINLDI